MLCLPCAYFLPFRRRDTLQSAADVAPRLVVVNPARQGRQRMLPSSAA
jgi:hypothetical protein